MSTTRKTARSARLRTMSNVIKFPEPKQKAPDKDERIQRIRSSLDKINKLMAELKNINTPSEGK